MLANYLVLCAASLLAFPKGVTGDSVAPENSSWTTLTPTNTIAGMQTSYPSAFGIAIEPIASASASASAFASANKKRAASTVMQPVTQIGDGQIQGTTATSIQNNYIYVTTTQSVAYTVSATNTQTLISTTKATTTCDQCSTSFTVFTLGDSGSSASCGGSTTYTTVIKKSTYIVASSLPVCSTAASISETMASSTISALPSTSTSSPSTSLSANDSSSVDSSSSSSSVDSSSSSSSSDPSSQGIGSTSVSCKKAGTLTMNLNNSILKDSANRIGSIVANRQFQFDGPTPQAGAIYAAGWGIYNGNLVIGTTQVFYQCLSGTFYNLYDQSIGSQCSPVHLKVVQLIDC